MDKERIVSFGNDARIVLWNIPSGQIIETIQLEKSQKIQDAVKFGDSFLFADCRDAIIYELLI